MSLVERMILILPTKQEQNIFIEILTSGQSFLISVFFLIIFLI